MEYSAPGCVTLTPAGRDRAQAKTISSRSELHAAWDARLPRPQMALLRALIATHPQALSREDLAARAAQSPTSSAFQNNLGALRSLGLIEYRPGRLVAATPLLFPAGLP